VDGADSLGGGPAPPALPAGRWVLVGQPRQRAGIRHTGRVSFLFSARPPRRDKELADANERTRRALARDINDEDSLVFDPLPRRRRSGMWMVWAVIAFLVAGALGVLPRVGGVPIEVDCTTAGIALSSYSVPAGSTLQWKVTGPDGPQYVLALDAAGVTGIPGGTVQAETGTVVTPRPFRMASCEGGGPAFAAPSTTGQHFVRLFRSDGSGYVQVAQVALAVR
jgi:hypothetical protein